MQKQWIESGAKELYEDPILYDFEYQKRRYDIKFYTNLVNEIAIGKTLKILELGCGTGRLSLPLAKLGHHITGIDRSLAMLEQFQKKISSQTKPEKIQSRIQLRQGDFRNLKNILKSREKFSLILCPFNTLMHLYSLEEIESTLKQIHHFLSPNGFFIFDVENPNLRWLLRDPEKHWSKTKFKHPLFNKTFLYSTNHVYDPISQIVFIRIYYQLEPTENGNYAEKIEMEKNKTVLLTQRQFFPAELKALLHYHKFSIRQCYGDFFKKELSAESDHQIIISQKL